MLTGESVKVSIVTVVYNASSTICTAIDSIRNQSYPNIEIVVVDGNSTDGTLEKLQSYGNEIDTLISEKDQGIYDAMNKGLSLATGDIVGTLNADDLYANENVIQKVVSKFQGKEVDALYGDLVYIDPKSGKIVRYWQSGDFATTKFLFGFMPPHPTFFMKRECYSRYGLFNLELTSSADYELMLRYLYLYQVSCAYLPEIITLMRTGGQSNASLRNRFRANFEDFQAWRINKIKALPITTLLKFLLKLPQFIKRPSQSEQQKLTFLKGAQVRFDNM